MPGKSSRRESQGVWAALILAHTLILILLVVLALGYLNPTLGLRGDAEFTIALTSVCLLLVFIWSLWSWRALTGDLFDPYALFLIAASLFHGGHAFLRILELLLRSFRLSEYSILSTQIPPISLVAVSPETLLQALFLSTLGLAAFHAGGLLASMPLREVNRKVAQEDHKISVISTARASRIVGLSLLAVALVPAFFYFRDIVHSAVTSGYFEYLKQGTPTRFGAAPRILATFLVPASLFLLAGSKNHRYTIALSGIVVLMYSSTLFLVGHRSWSAMVLIAFVWVYHRCVRPLPKMLLLGAGGILMFVVIPATRFFRDVTGGSRFSLSVLWDTFLSIDNPVTTILSEMGYTLMTVAYTVSRVPGYRDFDMGLSYLYSLLMPFPSLFWAVHPSYARGTWGDWLVATVEPVSANLGHYSFGFSFIAEAYANFGWFGAPLILAVMGFLLARFVLWAGYSTDPAKIAMLGTFTSFVLVFARGESHELLRFLAWYALLPYIGVSGVRLLIQSRSYRARSRFRGPTHLAARSSQSK